MKAIRLVLAAALAAIGASCLAQEGSHLRFGVMTDTHVTGDPASCGRLRQALELFRRERVALVVNNGDVADYNHPEAYANYRRTFDAVFAGGERPRELYAYAAHDAFERDFSTPNASNSYARMQKALGANAPTDALQLGGHAFLVFPQYAGQPGLVSWEEYERRVAKACADNPGRPVFVIDHVPPAGTVYHSWSWGERRTREILNRHPQVVNFSGHVHGSLRNDVFLWQGEFTAVNAGCLQLWSGIAVGEPPERKPSYGVLTVDAHDDRLVIRRWDVRDGREIDAEHRWTVPLPFDPATAPYARKALCAREPAPQFAASARLRAAAEGTPFAGFRLDFPEKVPGVMNFRIEAQRKTADGWTPVVRIERISDYWKGPSDRPEACDYLFSAAYFEPAAEYRIAVSPVGQYGAVGRAICAEVSTPAASAFAPAKVVYDCAEPMRELAFNDREGRRYVAAADGFYATGDISEPCSIGPAAEWTWGAKDRNRLILPDGIFAGPVGTRYRLTLDLRTQQAAEGAAMKMLLQKPDQLGVPGVTGRLRTPNGDSGATRYVLEFTKDAQNASDTYHVTFDAGHGRIRFDRIVLEILENAPAGLKLFGVAYYPEVWPRTAWARDLDLMREVGFNAVRVGEFNWSGFEPREGQFDFDEYRAFLALCAEKGMRVVMCTPTAALPPWMRCDHPDTEKTGIDGTRPSLGGRQTYCPSSPELRRFSARVVTRMAEAFRDAPAIVAWQLDNELNVHGGTGVCHCRRCADGFRAFLRRRYGTLEKLNRELNTAMWGARFSKWEEIGSQFGLSGRDGLGGIRAAWAREYLDYAGEAYFDLCRDQARILRGANPKWRITTNNPEASGCARYDRLYRELDYAACDTYVATGQNDRGVRILDRVRWMWNMFRGMRGPQQGFTVAETGVTNFNPSETDGDRVVRCFFWDAVFHGAESFFYFRWRQSVLGEDEHTAVLPWSGRPSAAFRRLKAQCDEARRSGLDLATLPPEPTPVAILHDPFADQHALARIGQLQGGPLEKTAMRINAALERFGIVPDCLQMDADPDFAPYRLVILPLCARVSESVAAKLRAHVANGGAVAAVVRLDDLTPYGGFVTEPYPLKLKDVFGLSVNERRSLDDDHYHELLEPGGAETLDRFATGSFVGEPRLVRNAFGKGRALYLAETPTNESALEDVRKILDAAGIPHGRPLPPCVRRARRGGCVGLINLCGEEQRIPAERGEAVLGRHVVEGGKTVLAPWDVVILRQGNGPDL